MAGVSIDRTAIRFSRRRFLAAAAAAAMGVSAMAFVPAKNALAYTECQYVSCVPFAEECQPSSVMCGYDTWHVFYNCYDQYFDHGWCYEMVYDTLEQC